jgi:hypothetical protein
MIPLDIRAPPIWFACFGSCSISSPLQIAASSPKQFVYAGGFDKPAIVFVTIFTNNWQSRFGKPA